ncbi:hypothetical protein GXP67_29575 [Rhodocytophaga rosea]|uniref:Uncharacterized protein n=1 Tax=Rhodocytophaga rosea TaxID=2704465 RepID=A0A6C0GRE8_9BACT|nr:hypothetical protein [Rhodocytophaga rosea]QHT70507.1 hypothetical protein GXP67_29575 [Rhodocytophaga rosea]
MRKATFKRSFQTLEEQEAPLHENRRFSQRSPGYGQSFLQNSKQSSALHPTIQLTPTKHYIQQHKQLLPVPTSKAWRLPCIEPLSAN